MFRQPLFRSSGRYSRMVRRVAWLWRRLLFRPRFVAVTGSLGKTTAKEATAAVLSRRFSVLKSQHNINSHRGLWRTVLRVMPWHDHAVIEVAAGENDLSDAAATVRPDIVVVTLVKLCHRSTFRTIDRVAEEKAKLLAPLGDSGVAVLNADDPLVAAMAGPLRCRVVWFGQAPDADVRYGNLRSGWPERLSFDLSCGGRTVRVNTRLAGAHLAPSMAAAAAVGWVCGLPLEEISAGLESVPPFTARFEPVRLPSGAVLIRDEYSGVMEGYTAGLQMLGEARVERRVVVFGDFADSSLRDRRRMKWLGKSAAGHADLAVFVGERAETARRAAMNADESMRAEAFVSFEDAAEFLRSELRAGDLVLLKGRTREHLSRLYFTHFGEVSCWKSFCEKRILCDVCDQLGNGVAARAVEFQALDPF